MRDDLDEISKADARIATLRRFLDSDNDVLRCAAVKVLPAIADDKAALRATLTSALLDPDPDVRSDAMDALSNVASPDDVQTIVRSLEGDPVREVKLSAIGALCRLKDDGAIDLLRALALSRAEDRVSWEDEASDWEDWLDIQIAAIAALGDLGASEAVDDLVAARTDEFGQTLDIQVFNAWSRMGAEGVGRLLEVIRTEDGLPRQRAVSALARVAPETLTPYIDGLLAADDPQLRHVALKAMMPGDPRVSERAVSDPDAGIRLAALNLAGPQRPDLALQALNDTDPAVQAAALDQLHSPLTSEISETLADNLLAWLETAPPVLMAAAVRHLPAFASNRAAGPLVALIVDNSRPLEARIAAVKSLAEISPPVATATFADLLASPAQQVRTTALVHLSERANAGDEKAQSVIADAILERLLSDADATALPRSTENTADAAAPKGEGEGRPNIRITPDGEIVTTSDQPDNGAARSTLASILDGSVTAPDLAEDTPEESAPKRRKRRAVEGPDEIAEALALEAMQCVGAFESKPVDVALLKRARDSAVVARRAAWQAIERRCGALAAGADIDAAAAIAWRDPDPVVRLSVFSIRTKQSAAPELIAEATGDEDALIRAASVAYLPPERALDHLDDAVLAVRSAALERLMSSDAPGLMTKATDRLVEAQRSDTLASLLSSSETATARALSALLDDSLPLKKALVVLNAFGQR